MTRPDTTASTRHDRLAILVAGAEDGATTALARTFDALGAPLPAGLAQDVADIHRSFLATIGSADDDPLPLPAAALEGRPAQACHDELVEALRRQGGQLPLLTVAAPQMGLLLPLWLRALDTCAIGAVVVLALRQPGDGRHAGGPARWLGRMLAAERHSRSQSRVFADYQSFVADPLAAAEAVAERLGCLPPTRRKQARPALEALWAPEQEAWRPAPAAESLPAWARRAYDALVQATENGAADTADLDAMADQLDEAADLLAPALALPSASRARLGRLEAELTTLAADNDALRRQATADCTRRTEAEDAARRSAEKAARLEGERDILLAELERVRQERDDLAGARADLTAEMDRALAFIREREADIAAQAQRGEAAVATLARLLTAGHGRLSLPQRLGGLVRAALRGRLRQRLAEDRAIAVIAASGRFDANYYLRRYSDIAAAGVDPIVHYVRSGAREGRNPHPAFDTRFYTVTYPDVARAAINPLVHYLQHGRGEGRLPNAAAKGAPPHPAGLDALLTTSLFGGSRFAAHQGIKGA